MQDIIFYVAAGETLGSVRDSANARNEPAPVLVRGVSVRLKMRLFADRDVSTAYPMDSLDGIAAWSWSMDADFSSGTACKLNADQGAVQVQSVTDTVNGKTMTFTEFTIPISKMNTQELISWLGSEESKSGLTGELTGYDGLGNAVFVIQIRNFTVRNRIAVAGSPTIVDQEYVTRNEAQSMILYAISGGATINVSSVTSAVSAGYAESAGRMANATEYGYGTVKVSSAVLSSTTGSDVYVPTVNAMIGYLNTYVSSGGMTTSGYVGSAIQTALSSFADSNWLTSGGSRFRPIFEEN